jgi:hypothetical protein
MTLSKLLASVSVGVTLAAVAEVEFEKYRREQIEVSKGIVSYDSFNSNTVKYFRLFNGKLITKDATLPGEIADTKTCIDPGYITSIWKYCINPDDCDDESETKSIVMERAYFESCDFSDAYTGEYLDHADSDKGMIFVPTRFNPEFWKKKKPVKLKLGRTVPEKIEKCDDCE